MPKRKTTTPESSNTDEIAYLLRYLVALNLNERGVPQAEIAKRLHIKTEAVNQMLKRLRKTKHDKK